MVDIHVSQWQKKIQMVQMFHCSALKSILKEQIEQMEELRIPPIVLSTKDDMLWLIGEAKHKVVFGRQH